MVNAVMEREEHLLSDEEWDVLRIYSGLDCKSSLSRVVHSVLYDDIDCARYLLVRLAFRQPEWHALYSLDKYASEIGQEGLELALKRLCVPIKDLAHQPTPPPSPTLALRRQEKVKEEEDAVPSLSFSDSEGPPKPTLPPKPTQIFKPSTKTSDCEIEEPVVDPRNLKFDYFFRDQSSMTVRETLSRLPLPDLREISKSMKVGSYTMRVRRRRLGHLIVSDFANRKMCS
jgi:Fanconi-associated nuclease 1